MDLPLMCLRVAVVSLVFLCHARCDVRIYVIGDWGFPDSTVQPAVADGMAQYAATYSPEFVVALGDNFYDKGISSVNDPIIDSLWRDMYNHTTLRDLHWYLALGNHDYGLDLGEEWNQVALTDVEPRWHVPYLWHYLPYTDGDVTIDLIFIDTNALLKRKNGYTAMMQWLEDTLEASVADWVIVLGHHPIYSCACAGPALDILYNELLPVLDRYRDKVDVYLAGHDHNLQLIQDVSDPGYIDFVVSGTGGAPLYPEAPTYEDILLREYNITKMYFDHLPAFNTITATPDALQFDFIAENTMLLYSYTRIK